MPPGLSHSSLALLDSASVPHPTQRPHGSFRKLLLPKNPLPITPCAVGLDCVASPAGFCDSLGQLNLVGLSSNTFVWFLCPCASESVDF